MPLVLLCALSLLGFFKKAGNARYCQEKKSTKLKRRRRRRKKQKQKKKERKNTFTVKGGREKNCKSVTFCAHATVELTRKMVNWSWRSVKEVAVTGNKGAE